MSKRYSQKQAARVVREQLARERRRKQQLWVTIGVVALLVAAGLVGWAIYSNQRPATVAKPAHVNKDGSGLVVGSGPVTVDLYIDFQCPACKVFEEGSSSLLSQYVKDKKITLAYHTMAILDRTSPNQYSTRSAATAGCASDGGKLVEYAKALFDNQVEEGTAGPTDQQLIGFGSKVGLGNDFAKCVNDRKYWSWVSLVNDKAQARGVSGTPTIFVNNRELKDTEKTPDGLKKAMDGAS